MAMSLVHTDDNLIEARLRQLEARTSITGSLPPPPSDYFWPELPVTVAKAAPTPATPNRWLGPVLGIVVGSVVTHLITAFGSAETRPAPTRVASVATESSAAPAATPGASDPTTQALARLIAAKPPAPAASVAPVRAIDTGEIVKLQEHRKLTLGRQDPFAVIRRDAPLPELASLPPVQVIVPEPPPAPVATTPPKPTSQIRFNGSFAVDGAYTALVEESAHGQTVSRRWRLGDVVLGGYRVAEIGLRTLKLRLGGETILLSAGSSQDLESRSASSGLSAIAPEPFAPTGVKPAVWRPSPPLPNRSDLSTPMATPLPPSIAEPPRVEAPAPDVPAPVTDVKGSAATTGGSPSGALMQ